MTVVLTQPITAAKITKALEDIGQVPTAKSKKNAGKYFGALKGEFPNPLEIQKAMRDEWK